jgi:hypothetical protein
VKRALALLVFGAGLCGCQAVSGLDQLHFVSADGGSSNTEACAADGCDAPRSCDFVSQAPCGAGMQCARFSEDPVGDFCVTPATDCPSDGRCDEPSWGTRRCAAGSDTADCACSPAVSGASCDLVDQCGCSPGSHCALLEVHGATASVGCTPDVQPTREPGAACNAESECAAGYSCWRGLCEKYCAHDADCTSGRCIALRDPAELAGVGVCSVACDFASDSGCQKGTRCAHTPDGQNYCLVPRTPCPFTGDGVCDEPQGSRICASGSDSVDCS